MDKEENKILPAEKNDEKTSEELKTKKKKRRKRKKRKAKITTTTTNTNTNTTNIVNDTKKEKEKKEKEEENKKIIKKQNDNDDDEEEEERRRKRNLLREKIRLQREMRMGKNVRSIQTSTKTSKNIKNLRSGIDPRNYKQLINQIGSSLLSENREIFDEDNELDFGKLSELFLQNPEKITQFISETGISKDMIASLITSQLKEKMNLLSLDETEKEKYLNTQEVLKIINNLGK